MLTWPFRTFFQWWGWRSSNYITCSGGWRQKFAILLKAIIEKIFTRGFLIVETASKLTSCNRCDTAKIFQEISIVVAIAFSEFLQIGNLRNSTLTFQTHILPTLLQDCGLFVDMNLEKVLTYLKILYLTEVCQFKLSSKLFLQNWKFKT